MNEEFGGMVVLTILVFYAVPLTVYVHRLPQKLMVGGKSVRNEHRAGRSVVESERPRVDLQVSELRASDPVEWSDPHRQADFGRTTRWSGRLTMKVLTLRTAGHLILTGGIGLAFSITHGLSSLAIAHAIFFAFLMFIRRLSRRRDLRFEHIDSVQVVLFPAIIFHGTAALYLSDQEAQSDYSWGVYLTILPIGFFWLVPMIVRRRNRPPDNVRADLLILRVFSTGENAYLEKQIEPSWRFLGSTNTITSTDVFSDTENFKHLEDARIFGWKNFVVLLPVLPTFFFGKPGDGWLVVLVSVYLVAAYILMRRLIRRSLERTYLKDEMAVDEAVLAATRQGRDRSGAYPNLRFNCQGEAWRTTIERLLPVVSAILVDARGFSEKNLGIGYELGLIMDIFPLESAVIVIDKSTDWQALLGLLEAKWMQSIQESALHDPSPVLKVVRCENMDRSTVNRICSLLYRDAMTPA